MVITFMPSFVFTLGAPLCDSLFLAPFYCHAEVTEPIVKSDDRLAPSLHEALSKLVGCYFNPSEGFHYRAGCKAYLLEAMYSLSSRFPPSVSARSEHLRRQEQARLLGKLHEYLLENYSAKIPLSAACSIVGMSEAKFMKYFKAATGETFVSYLTRLRVQRAMQMLEEGNRPIAEIAAEVGFSDQSYFDKMFRRYFGRTPSHVRRPPVILPVAVPAQGLRAPSAHRRAGERKRKA
jgi:AraC-like DNA-binding protein